MISNKFSRILLIALTLMLTVLQSCGFDQRERKYADYKSANQDQLFENGWIPYELAFESMTDINQRTNLDLNTCAFSFKLSKTDLKTVKQKATATTAAYKAPRRINLAADWSIKVPSLKQYIFRSSTKIDFVHLAIDDQNNTVYGWRN